MVTQYHPQKEAEEASIHKIELFLTVLGKENETKHLLR